MMKQKFIAGVFEECFKGFHYPAGELHIEANRLVLSGGTILAANIRNFEGLASLVVANRILERAGGELVEWFVPYFPFGRHDRRRHRADGFELGLALEMMKELNVLTLDPHSEVLAQLPHIPQSEVVRLWSHKGLFDVPNPAIVIPDAGASKKAYSWTNQQKVPVFQGTKHRDPSTGALSGFSIIGEPDEIAGRDIIIVDDICDAGGTFLGLGEKLEKEYQVASLTLAVTHGLFTKGTDHLHEVFDRIFTTGRPIHGITCLSHQDIHKEANRV